LAVSGVLHAKQKMISLREELFRRRAGDETIPQEHLQFQTLGK